MRRVLPARRDAEDGVALIVAIAFLFIMTLFATMLVATMRSTQVTSRRTKNVTTARAEADAGVEAITFALGLTGSDSSRPWNDYLCTGSNAEDPTQAPGSCVHTDDIGDGTYWATVTKTAVATQRQINVVGEYPKGSGDRVRLKVVVNQSAPKAFEYSMFGDTDITVHHHGTILAPQITTTSIHSNGDMDLPLSSEVHVQDLTVVGNLELKGDGDGKTVAHPWGDVDGSIGPDGYSFRYDIGPYDRCYPMWEPLPADGVTHNVSHPSTTTPVTGVNGCTQKKFPGYTQVYGDIRAGSFTMGSRSEVLGSNGQKSMSMSGDLLDPVSGNVTISTSGEASFPGKTFSSTTPKAYTAAECAPYCDNGAPGTIAGSLTVEQNPPQAIEFPSIDYENTYKVRALNEESGSCGSVAPAVADYCGNNTRHVFDSEDDFLSYITAKNRGYYRYIDDAGDHHPWTFSANKGDGPPNYILLIGDYYVYGGLNLDAGDINNRVADQLNNGANDIFDPDGPSIPIVIAGSLVSPDKGMTMKGRVYIVGRGNQTDFLYRLPGSANVEADLCVFANRRQGPAKADTAGGECNQDQLAPSDGFSEVEPGLLAAGGDINASDIDDDKPWESDSDYELLRDATWVRGVVYSAAWDAKTGTSQAAGQHWHNADPKNSVRILGAQIGAKLHDCNNFDFTYDSIVKNAFGFSGEASGVEVVSWDEL